MFTLAIIVSKGMHVGGERVVKSNQRASISMNDRLNLSNLLDRCTRRNDTRGMRVKFLRLSRKRRAFLLAIVFLGLSSLNCTSYAQGSASIEPHTTLVIFADHRMQDNAWIALFDAVRAESLSVAATSPAPAGPADLVRGDKMRPGVEIDKPITVYLHGDCTLKPTTRMIPTKPLGWVLRVNDQIEPFIHVDCEEIAQVVEQVALGMSRGRRATVMSEAIARVILHEWVHVATQNPRHTEEGISKSTFGVKGLLTEDEALQRNQPKFVYAWRDVR